MELIVKQYGPEVLITWAPWQACVVPEVSTCLIANNTYMNDVITTYCLGNFCNTYKVFRNV